MDIKDIKLKKGMTRAEVNKLISEWLTLEDDVYNGALKFHSWSCKCGNIIKDRKWNVIQYNNSYECNECKYNKVERKYKYEVEKDGDYEYIRSYRRGDILPNGKSVGDNPYIQVKHKYCRSVHELTAAAFINTGIRCSNCCKIYENSFAHHIEVELGLKLEDVWDFEKNTVNPYHVYKGSQKKVWIKCKNEEINKLNGLKKKDYHGSYEIGLNNFVSVVRCGKCNPKNINNVHPYDSFGYHHFDKVLSWHPDNEISPFKVSIGSHKRIKFICEKCSHEWQKIVKDESWCPMCNKSKGEKKIIEYLDKKGYFYLNDEPCFENLTSIYNRVLRPDFILPEHKIWIEYDGVYHFEDVNKDGSFESLKIRDKRKDEYAKKHGWKMIRIPYWEFDNIEEILEKEIQ